MMIHVFVVNVALSNVGFVVMLKGVKDERTLPIFIGGPEAQSIALFMEKVNLSRPLTHDLFKNVMDNVECRMKRAEIIKLQDNTFYAGILLERDGLESKVDARPSDAIALALRCSAPIYVADDVMDVAGVVIKDTMEKTDAVNEKKEETPIEMLENEITKAVKEERYEDAAKLRDEIRKLKSAN